MGRSHECRVHEARHREVIRVRAASGNEPRRLRPDHCPADVSAVRRPRWRARATLRRSHDRLNDGVVTRATAVVPAESFTDSDRVRMGLTLQQRMGRQEHARRAESALQRVFLAERVLKMGESPALGQAFDRLDLRALGLDSEHQAATDEAAIHAHGARAAHTVLAADVRPHEPQLVAEEVDQVLPRLDVPRGRRSVHAQRHLHARPSMSLRTTRASSTRARCRRRAGEP